MLGSFRTSRLTFCVVLVLFFVILYFQLQNIYTGLRVKNQLGGDHPNHELSKEAFVAGAIEAARGDDYDDTSIREMCNAQTWDKSVVFTCHGLIGGIGNIKQEILHCIRYAIDAGAGLIIPVINIRSKDDLSDLESGKASLDYLFDKALFLYRLKTACPQMPIYQDLEELKKTGSVKVTETIEIEKFSHWPLIPASSRARVEELKATDGQISLIPFKRVWRYFRVCYDSKDFANNFGNILPLRQDVYRLAATTLYELASRQGFAHNPFVDTAAPAPDTFLGIHLRTASDILSYWLTYEDQVKYYLSRIRSSDYLSSLPVIYVASGNITSIRSFSLESESMPVVTKRDILSGADLAELDSLTWDQQALVDLLVLNRGAFFMGMADSSFAWTISHGRRRFSKKGTCQMPKGFWKSKLWGTAFEDEYSDLIGNHGYGWEDKMWP